ncbi:hypothetical protein BDV24DRAFT_166171 [Aspergillus arachidicola]|uniref:Uncharacterized protein n=1 Tax=Aspergillus arachidicola TaxID=656916 RepID=A0A2G7G3F9_9EURO|nr:hypothetical protein BDV24DRAFT_166171 [Aspergillus arachidicola]PIG87115.1 hypothetical protein AARAC_009705 [Aspergillus arachidicola]
MSSPSVQVQPQPSGGAKGVSHTTKEAGAMNFDIVRCSRCQRSMSLENDSSPGVPLCVHGRLYPMKQSPPAIRATEQEKRNDIVTNAFFVVPSSSPATHRRL